MKTLLLFFITFLSQLLFSQRNSDSINIRYQENIKEYRLLKITDENIENTIECVNDFKNEYSKLLQVDDLSNVAVQKAIIRDYSNKCNSFIKDKENNGLYVFKTKDLIEKYMIIQDDLMKMNASVKILDFLIIQDEKYNKVLDSYIQKNLTRLKMPYSEFEKLSQNDKELLFKTFQK